VLGFMKVSRHVISSDSETKLRWGLFELGGTSNQVTRTDPS